MPSCVYVTNRSFEEMAIRSSTQRYREIEEKTNQHRRSWKTIQREKTLETFAILLLSQFADRAEMMVNCCLVRYPQYQFWCTATIGLTAFGAKMSKHSEFWQWNLVIMRGSQSHCRSSRLFKKTLYTYSDPSSCQAGEWRFISCVIFIFTTNFTISRPYGRPTWWFTWFTGSRTRTQVTERSTIKGSFRIDFYGSFGKPLWISMLWCLRS